MFLFTLTLNNPDSKSVPGKEVAGRDTAANAVPPGCVKFMGTRPDAISSLAASPVSSAYLRGYWNDTPQLLSEYVTVEGRFLATFFGAFLAGSGTLEAGSRS